MTTASVNKKILVVDDEERMLRFIRLNLEHDGFQVIEAVKGTRGAWIKCAPICQT